MVYNKEHAHKIAESVVDTALNGGYTVCVWNGASEPELVASTDKAEIMNAMFKTSFDNLVVSLPDGEYYGDVYVTESRGYHALSDWTRQGDFADFISPAFELAHQLEEQSKAAALDAPGHVSDAVLDEVFEQHADEYQRSIHGIASGDEQPPISVEQVGRLSGDQKPMSYDDQIMQIAEELENGFPSQNPLFAELHQLEDIQRQVLGDKFTPSIDMDDSQVDEQPATERRVVNFGRMADRAEAAAGRGGQTEKALETTSEQGA